MAVSSFAQKRARATDLRVELRNAIPGLEFVQEGTDPVKVLRLPPATNIKATLLAWISNKHKSDRPHNYRYVETESSRDFFEDLITFRPDWGDIEEDKPLKAQWRELKELLERRLVNLRVWHFGDDPGYRIIVVAGRDRAGNITGIWMRHISS
jgi:hypothetical protein